MNRRNVLAKVVGGFGAVLAMLGVRRTAVASVTARSCDDCVKDEGLKAMAEKYKPWLVSVESVEYVPTFSKYDGRLIMMLLRVTKYRINDWVKCGIPTPGFIEPEFHYLTPNGTYEPYEAYATYEPSQCFLVVTETKYMAESIERCGIMETLKS